MDIEMIFTLKFAVEVTPRCSSNLRVNGLRPTVSWRMAPEATRVIGLKDQNRRTDTVHNPLLSSTVRLARGDPSQQEVTNSNLSGSKQRRDPQLVKGITDSKRVNHSLLEEYDACPTAEDGPPDLKQRRVEGWVADGCHPFAGAEGHVTRGDCEPYDAPRKKLHCLGSTCCA